jgi:DNA-binding beta-propeller fold protein YncE
MDWSSLRSLLAIAAAGLATAALPAADQPLVLVKSIPLPGVEGRIDHLAVDQGQARMFVAALGNNSVEVLDLTTGQHLRSVKGLHEPQGIAALASPPQVVVANGQGAVEFRAGDDLRVARSVALGEDADNVRYDAKAKRIYVGYGSGAGGAIGAIDASDGRQLGNAPVGGHPESFQLEASGPRIFVNVPTAKQIAVIDRLAMKVTAMWPVAEAASNFPMALDEAGHRLFIGCRQPAKVLIVDTSSGKVVSAVDIVGDTDDIFWDAARKRLYVTGGEGFVDVLQPSGASLARTARIATAAGARTALFVSEQSRFYIAVPHRGAQNAEIRVYDVKD